MIDGTMEGGEAGNDIGAVEFVEMEIREACNQLGNVAAGGLSFDRDGDGVVIVLHANEERQLHEGGSVHGFPELALTCSAIAERDIDNFVAVEHYILEFAIVAFGLPGGVG